MSIRSRIAEARRSFRLDEISEKVPQKIGEPAVWHRTSGWFVYFVRAKDHVQFYWDGRTWQNSDYAKAKKYRSEAEAKAVLVKAREEAVDIGLLREAASGCAIRIERRSGGPCLDEKADVALIQRALRALGAGASEKQVARELVKSGIAKEDVFLAIKAAGILLKDLETESVEEGAGGPASDDFSTPAKTGDFLRTALALMFPAHYIRVEASRGVGIAVGRFSEEEYAKAQMRNGYSLPPNLMVKINIVPGIGSSVWADLKAGPTEDNPDLREAGVAPIRRVSGLTPAKAVSHVIAWFRKNQGVLGEERGDVDPGTEAVEEEKGKERHPLHIQRCVYAIAQKDPTPEGLSKAFAICIAKAQKAGKLEPGSNKPTAAGKARDKGMAQEPSESGFTKEKYEKLLALARAQRKESLDDGATLAGCWYAAHREILGEEARKDMKQFRAAVAGIGAAVKEFRALAADDALRLQVPAFISRVATHALGTSLKPGIASAMGMGGLLSAAGVGSQREIGTAIMGLLDALRDSPSTRLPWADLQKRAAAIALAASDLEETAKPGELVSILMDLFVDLARFAALVADGAASAGVKAAAMDVATAMKNAAKGFRILAVSDPGED